MPPWTESAHRTLPGLLHLTGIRVRRLKEAIIRRFWFFTAIFAVVAILFILLFLVTEAIPAFTDIGVAEFVFGQVWNPTGVTVAYGAFPLIVGTLLVTLGAMAIAVPLGIGCAIFVAELAPDRVKAVIKPAIELLAGIPSVVYGFFGLVVLTNWIRITFDTPTGETWLAGSILLGVMALPTIVSVSEDAIAMVPREYREGALALGATRWQTISRVTVPAALSGITAAIILGMGRAIGETMAVLMVTGNAAIIPDPIWNVLSPIRTLTGTLGIEMGEVASGSLHYHALFGLALLLLLITLAVNLTAVMVLGRIRGAQTASVCPPKPSRLIPPLFSRARRSPFLLPVLAITGAALLGGLLAGVAGGLCGALAAGAVFGLRGRISRKRWQTLAFGLIGGATVLVVVILGIIISDIVVNGLPAISWEFLTTSPRDLGRGGGIFPAIVGTLYLVTGAILFALPIGIGAAIYLTEYTREGRITRIIRTGTDLLNGTPSIVFGLFGFAFLVLMLNAGISLIAGQITLGLMILPTVIRTSEESLKAVPDSMREGSLALGTSRWQTIRHVVLPAAIPGVLTGTILAIGRAAGETAPILFTAVVFTQRYLPSSVLDPVMALPYHLFILATSVPGARENQYGTALVLLAVVLMFYLCAIGLRHRYARVLKW